jgi:hypothetical protein
MGMDELNIYERPTVDMQRLSWSVGGIVAKGAGL